MMSVEESSQTPVVAPLADLVALELHVQASMLPARKRLLMPFVETLHDPVPEVRVQNVLVSMVPDHNTQRKLGAREGASADIWGPSTICHAGTTLLPHPWAKALQTRRPDSAASATPHQGQLLLLQVKLFAMATSCPCLPMPLNAFAAAESSGARGTPNVQRIWMECL